MFTVTENGSNRLDLAFSGKVDSEAMKETLDDLIDKSQGIEYGRMLYRIGDCEVPSFRAIGIKLSRFPELLKLIGKFDKAAVIANQSWIRGISSIEGALIPGLEIKAFKMGEEAAAEAWLAE